MRAVRLMPAVAAAAVLSLAVEAAAQGAIGLEPLPEEPVETRPLDAPSLESPPEGGFLAPEGGTPPRPEDGAEIRYAEGSGAVLRGLDTLTNTVNDFEIGVGETLAFKRLIVTLEACRYPEGDIEADAYAYLRIRDEREDEDRFAGWMLASSPALSALDHPRYDVWVLSCSTD